MDLRRPISAVLTLLVAIIMLVAHNSVALVNNQVANASEIAQNGVSFGATIKAASCDQPPDQKVKDHASLNDAELRKYGFPPRPKDAKHLALWEENVRVAKTRVCDMKPVYENGKPKKSASLNEARAANAQVPQWISCCDNGLGKWGDMWHIPPGTSTT